MRLIFLLFILLWSGARLSAQCVIINEVMVNPSDVCDGACEPNTAEWIELYNTCNTPVDLSCYVLTDGDYTVTFPAGSSIAANGYFVIGSINSGGPVDLNISNCGCTAGNTIGVLSNSSEQLILLNSLGVEQDAIVWGGGQFPMNITSITLGACAPLTINRPNSTGFVNVPVSPDGCSVGRTCDAATTWQAKCGSNISMGATNGTIVTPAFSASSTNICPGDCINFTDNSTGTPDNWFWTFSGAATATSTAQNPSSICYNNVGNYTVTLQISNSCGTFTETQTGYIQVGTGATPTITANGPLSFCEGNSVSLSTTTPGTYQWLLNGNPISGETNSQITVTQSGDYSVSVGGGSCTGISNIIQVNVLNTPIANISALSSTTLCPGESVILNNNSVADNYVWMLNGNPINGSNTQQYTANTAGSYTLTVSNANGCSATSTPIVVTVLSVTTPIISSVNGLSVFCPGQSLELSSTTGLQNYQWFFNNALIPGANTSTYMATQGGFYTVTANSANGCSVSSAPFAITQSIAPLAQITPSGPLIICNAQPISLQTTSGAASYQWFNAGVAINGANTNTFIAGQSGSYSVTVTNAEGCSASSGAVQVSFNTGITVDIVSSNLNPCEGETVYLSTALLNYTQILWSTGENSKEIGVTNSGTYEVIVVNSGNCTARDNIQIVFQPKPMVDAGENVSSDCVYGAVLHASGEGIPNWEPALGLSNTNTFEVTAFPSNTTIYYLTVDNGICKATDSVLVIADCSSIYVPTSFTPNDDGLNDVFKAQGMDVQNFKLTVYNRWGEKVFYTEDINHGWDGTYKGTLSPLGVYVWELSASDKFGTPMLNNNQRRGIVTLLR